MTPGEHLDEAETALNNIEVGPADPNYVALHALMSIGRYLQTLSNQQSGGTAP